MTTPGYHVGAPVQNTNGHQSEYRTTNGLCSIKHLLVLTRECIEVGNRSSYFRAWENRYSFDVYFEGSHIGSSTFDRSNCHVLQFWLIFLIEQWQNFKLNRCRNRHGSLLQRGWKLCEHMILANLYWICYHYIQRCQVLELALAARMYKPNALPHGRAFLLVRIVCSYAYCCSSFVGDERQRSPAVCDGKATMDRGTSANCKDA